MTTLSFFSVGDFWLDNGYEILFSKINYLVQKGELQTNNLELDCSRFEIRGDDKAIEHAFSRVLGDAIQSYVRRSGEIGVYYDMNDKKFKAYKKESWQPHLRFLYSGIIPSAKNDVKPKKIDLGPDYVRQWAEFIKSTPRWKRDMPKNCYTSRPVLSLKPPHISSSLKNSSGKGRKRCSFCGRRSRTVEAQLNLHPFLVDRGKMATFYGEWKYGMEMCPLCVSASRMAPMKLLYRVLKGGSERKESKGGSERKGINECGPSQRKNRVLKGDSELILFMPHASSLARISEISALAYHYIPMNDKRVQDSNGKRVQNSNFRIDMGRDGKFEPQGLAETMLMFLLTIFVEHMDRGLSPEKLEDMRWVGIHAKISGDMVSYPKILIFDRSSELYLHFKALKEKKIDLTLILDRATIVRDELALKILNFESILYIVEKFLYETGKAHYRIDDCRIDDFVFYYEHVVMNMDEKSVDSCMKQGKTIGKLAFEADQKGRGIGERLLYEIRNSRKNTNLLNALNRAQFNLALGSLDEELVKEIEINQKDWERYKLLISIAAKNAYEREKYKAKTNQREIA